jgi:hypothetical protein
LKTVLPLLYPVVDQSSRSSKICSGLQGRDIYKRCIASVIRVIPRRRARGIAMYPFMLFRGSVLGFILVFGAVVSGCTQETYTKITGVRVDPNKVPSACSATAEKLRDFLGQPETDTKSGDTEILKYDWTLTSSCDTTVLLILADESETSNTYTTSFEFDHGQFNRAWVETDKQGTEGQK